MNKVSKTAVTIIRNRIEALRADVDKLKAVDSLIGEAATRAKKHDILNSIMELSECQSLIIDFMEVESMEGRIVEDEIKGY